jgi:hypothetical protein
LQSVSHGDAGKSNIDTEIFSADNDKFVLHDSQGFEPGEVDNLKIVQEFIERRSNMPHIKDRLHAIWSAPTLYAQITTSLTSWSKAVL